MMFLLFAADDALTGGGIVGGIVTLTGAMYFLWDKYTRRQSEREREHTTNAKDAIKVEEEGIRVGELARKAVSGAYKEALATMKESHEQDIRAVRLQLKAVTNRVTQVEGREITCQKELDVLREQNNRQEEELIRLRDEGVQLRAEVAQLKKLLQEFGAFDSTNTQKPTS